MEGRRLPLDLVLGEKWVLLFQNHLIHANTVSVVGSGKTILV